MEPFSTKNNIFDVFSACRPRILKINQARKKGPDFAVNSHINNDKLESFTRRFNRYMENIAKNLYNVSYRDNI